MELQFLNRDFVETVALFAPVHQGAIDAFKLLGLRSRQYWEALAWVVYGEGWSKRPGAFTFCGDAPRRTLDPQRLARWRSGPQVRLIESFLLRSIGDSPVTELSDADVANASRIARAEAGHAGRVGAALEEIVRSLPRSSSELVRLLGDLREEGPDAQPEVNEQLEEWRRAAESSPDVIPAELLVWRAQFNERFLPGVVRAEVELPNALKSAEYRYHWYLRVASATLAVAEGAIIAWGLNFTGTTLALGWFVAAGALLVLPQGTKSLTDALLGIGRRFRR
jgi:hypothetical protein